MSVEERTAALAEGMSLGAFKIDLVVDCHQQMHSLQVGVIGVKPGARFHELAGKMLDGVAEDFKRVSRFGTNVTAVVTERLAS